GFWFLRPRDISSLAAAQMCFYRVKRKPRPKPAMFLYAMVEGGVFEDVFLMSLSWGNSFSGSRSLKENRSASIRQRPGATVASAVNVVAGIDDPGHILQPFSA